MAKSGAKCSPSSSSATGGWVLLAGGTGFIGSQARAALERAGFRVKCASRRGGGGGIAGEDLRVDLRNVCLGAGAGATNPHLLAGCVCVVNCVGVKTARCDAAWEAAHVTTTRSLLRLIAAAGAACRGCGFVHVTVAGLSAADTDAYSRTKWASEQLVKEAAAAGKIGGLAVVRPGVVWGDGDDFSRNLAASVRHLPFFPAPSGAGKVAVVHVTDVAAVIAASVVEVVASAAPRRAAGHGGGGASVSTVDAVGPEALSLAELVRATSEAAGLGFGTTTIPVPAALMAAVVVPALELVMADPPITAAQLTLLRRGVTGDAARCGAVLAAQGRVPKRYTAASVRACIAHAGPLFGMSLRPDYYVRVSRAAARVWLWALALLALAVLALAVHG